jgi:L-asparaginase
MYHRTSAGRTAPVFDIGGLHELPRVDIVYAYAGADSVPIDALVAAGAKGLVLSGVGRGNIAPGQGAALRRARDRGVVVVVTTRTGSGGVPIERADGMIGAGDLNAQKARVLLTLALSRTSVPAEVARIFASQQ